MYDRTAGTFSFDPTRPTVVAANDMVQQRPRAKGRLVTETHNPRSVRVLLSILCPVRSPASMGLHHLHGESLPPGNTNRHLWACDTPVHKMADISHSTLHSLLPLPTQVISANRSTARRKSSACWRTRTRLSAFRRRNSTRTSKYLRVLSVHATLSLGFGPLCVFGPGLPSAHCAPCQPPTNLPSQRLQFAVGLLLLLLCVQCTFVVRLLSLDMFSFSYTLALFHLSLTTKNE